MKVILSNKHFKGITILLLFITGSISLLAAIPATYQQQFGLSAGGSILADIFNLKPAPVVSLSDDAAATVRTSKSNYVPGETAKITGEGFGANETVTLQVLHTDGTPNTGAGHAPWTVTSDGDGVFTSTWYVEADDSANSSFQLTAISQTASASANFTDAANAAADLDQCRNGRIINPKDCVGDGSGVSGWVNGNVGQSDGHYIEGYSIPYRMRLSDIGAGDWTLDIGYDTVHSSKHAIDFLTHYDLIGGANLTPTVPPHPLVFNHTAECIDPSDSWIGLPANANNCAGVASTSTFAIPKPIIPNSLGPNPPGDFPCDSPYPGGTVLAGAISCPGSTYDVINAAGQEYMTMWNGTITSIQYVSGQQNVVSGSGQQHTMMRVYFHVTAAQAAADGGNVDLGWGGHIGRTQDWGTNNSAGGISGSPYHMNLHGLCAGSTPNNGTLCTDGGSQDRSLSAAAVFLTGTIRIIKNMQAGSRDGTFHYTTTGANLSPSFDLTTVGGTADTIITGLQPGAKTVTETGPASPFLFVSLTCVDPDNGTTVNGQTANIDLDGGETVTCTYTNREDFNATQGRIIVVKEVPGTGDTTQFTFNPSANFPNPGSTFTAPFNLTDGGSKDSCGVGDNCLPPATYAVGETPNAEYTTTATCLSSVAGKAPDDPSAIHLEAGETKTCTFTNTPKAPSLSIQKTADAASVSAGDAIGFTVTVTNSNAAGTGTAKGVTLSDALPAGTGVDWSIASQTGGASCVINGAPPTETLACGPIDLAPGASFSVHVTSNTTEASCKAYPNTATAQATNNAQVTANASETVLCPNLSINKTADAASVSAGDTIGFTVTVTNSAAAGTGTAKGVTLSDALPAGTGVDWTIAGQSGGASCVINGAPPTETLACGPIDLAPGASFSVHVTSSTTEASCKAYPNTATADATNAPAIQSTASETVLCPNLSINKTADAASVSAGDTIGFTVTVTNSAAAGTGTAKGVTLSDVLPAGTGVDWTIQSQSGGASCVINGAPPTETLACGPIDLAPGASFSVHVTSATTEASCQAYPNTATADATNAPAIQSTASETVLCPNLSINKTADAASVSAGSPIGFTVTVTNSAAAGTGTAKGVTLSDALPAGSGVDWSIASQSGGASCVINGAPPTETLACGPIDLAPGASFSVHVTSSTTEASCKAYPNTATADATNAPAVQSTATETVLCPNLSVNKTADAALVDAGSPIGFTITVSNSGAAGTGTALGVTLNDVLPAGTGVDWTIQSQSGGASCVINGAPPTETLACGPIDLAPGASFSVHVTSATTGASCKAYPNTATADATNSAPVQSTATETVRCSDVSVIKSADAASVDAPGNVGFTITVSSNGPAPAQNVNLIDTLPTNGGLSWSIDGGTGAGSCSISSGTLTCAFGTMVAGTTKTVHITSSTTAATCGTVNNAVAVTADFEPDTSNNTASASEAVLCGTIVIIKNATPQSGSFSFTGTGPGYNSFNLSGNPAGGANVNTQTPLVAGTYSATEATQLGWVLTGIGGSTDPNTPYNCVVTGGHGSTGVGDLGTQAVTINLHGGDTVTCTFENTGSGATRTQGFWATHSPLAYIAWFGGSAFGHTFPGVPDLTLGNPPCRTISDLPTLMGGFWSGVSKTSTNKKRSPLDQARMQLLQQLLAAELNFSAFGTAPAGGFATIQSWENAYCGTNQNAINAAQQAAASFNSQGDSSTFTPGTSADSKNARAIANYVTWDVLP